MGTQAAVAQRSISGSGLVVTGSSSFGALLRPIQIEAGIDVPVERLFSAWTIPEYVEAWYPSKSETISYCDINLRRGCRYRFDLEREDDFESVRGTYRRVQSPHSLTYSLDSSLRSSKTLVIITFERVANSSRLRFRQGGFTNPQDRLDSAFDWTERIERLARLLGHTRQSQF